MTTYFAAPESYDAKTDFKPEWPSSTSLDDLFYFVRIAEPPVSWPFTVLAREGDEVRVLGSEEIWGPNATNVLSFVSQIGTLLKDVGRQDDIVRQLIQLGPLAQWLDMSRERGRGDDLNDRKIVRQMLSTTGLLPPPNFADPNWDPATGASDAMQKVIDVYALTLRKDGPSSLADFGDFGERRMSLELLIDEVVESNGPEGLVQTDPASVSMFHVSSYRQLADATLKATMVAMLFAPSFGDDKEAYTAHTPARIALGRLPGDATYADQNTAQILTSGFKGKEITGREASF